MRFFLDAERGSILNAHLVVRGTYLPGTVRCVHETIDRRPPYTSLSDLNIKKGIGQVKCYADVRVNSYILGSGPSTLTVVVRKIHFWSNADQEVVEELRSSIEYAFIEGGLHFRVEVPAGGIAGREEVMFIGPSIDYSVESWRVFRTWDVQRREDGTVIAVHPAREYWEETDNYQTYHSRLEMELPAFKQAVIAANQARVAEYGGRIAADATYPMLITDANKLNQFYTTVGAYNHPDGPPTQPPAPYVCVNGTAVPNHGTNLGLVYDCEALLAAKDTLRGAGSLNWSADTAISDWDGVTTGGTPSRVTKLELPNKSLSGSIPAELGSLIELTHVDLSGNSLTGEIPWQFEWLSDLVEIRLSGSSFTGCIPVVLKDVTTNDLSSLNILYCPPAPERLNAGTPDASSVPLSWDAVSNVTKYRVEYRSIIAGDSKDWILDDDTITTTTHTVDGLTCQKLYVFRVSSYGDGTVYAAAWGDWADSWSEDGASIMAACPPPTATPTATPAPPAAPTGLTATGGDGSVTLSWSNPQDSTITGYEYNVNHNATGTGGFTGWSSWQSISGSGAGTTSYTITGLTNGKVYRYHVRAVSASGEGGAAPNAAPWFVSATPKAPPPTPTPTPAPPGAPTGLAAAGGDGSVILAWNNPQDSTITRYEYQVRWTGVGWGLWTTIPGSGAGTTSYTLKGLTNGTEYRFRLRAVGAGGTGESAPNAAPWFVSATPQVR